MSLPAEADARRMSVMYPIGDMTHFTKFHCVPDRVHHGSCERSLVLNVVHAAKGRYICENSDRCDLYITVCQICDYLTKDAASEGVQKVGANPRNHLQHEGSYLTVERLQGETWRVVATDASWETQ
ncbi:hypothetical protein J6590_034289 [Homalodisca vitripennis]|nr:hypothetical protein J6590_034289 [Homalodisca vitripennis]